MFHYYITVFTILLFSFRERRIVCLGVLALINCMVAPYLIPLYMSGGGGFYEGALLIEISFLLLAGITYSIHESKGVLILFAVSISINLIGAYDTNPLVQSVIDSNYERLNIMLFEAMIGIIVVNTTWAINLSAKLKGNKPC